jgi:hypothetical protein
MQYEFGKCPPARQGERIDMFRMIFAIVVGVMEKTPRRRRRRLI